MKTRNKILIGVAAAFVLGISGAVITAGYDSPCPPVVAFVGEKPMRAAMHRCYGVPRGLRVENIAKPTPGDGQVLIKVRASSINPAEWYGVTGQPQLIRLFNDGIGRPSTAREGYDVAGTVEAVGANVTLFKPGDEVFGGVGGALAEYVIAREQGAIVMKPENMTFDEAAAIPIAAITALQGLRDQGRIAAGKKVLINGASGGVGTYAVQIAKSYGAEVTGVCSTRNVELVRSLGADHVVDYTRSNFTAGQERYDLILDNIGNHGFSALADVMKPDGTIVVVGGQKKGTFLGPIKRVAWSKVAAPFVEPRLVFFIASVKKPDLELLADLAREGKLKSVIDRRYPLEQAGAALEYLGGGHARGKVVVTIAGTRP